MSSRFARSPITQKLIAHFPALKNARVRASMALSAAVIVLAELLTIIQPYFTPHSYALGVADSLLTPVSQPMADKLKYDAKQQAYSFNAKYTSSTKDTSQLTGTEMTAVAYKDSTQGITVTDPVNNVDFSMTPQFGLWQGQQDGNRVVYPFRDGSGWVVYTMHSIGVKEDVLLTHPVGNSLSLQYTLGLGNGLVARVDHDGSIGIYGNTLFSGNVATGSDKDAALLQKARLNAQKDTLLFTIPAPSIKELGTNKSPVKAAYSLSGDTLRVDVTNLNKAHYPLTIDPSIYVVTARQFMEGNNETNIDFDVADKLIEKGKTTGARFDSWNATENLNTTTWRQGVAVAGGYIYTVGGTHPSGGTVSYTTVGTDTFVVPSGITSITVKAWGGGGGGGGGSTDGNGGTGGGGGFAQTTLTVTPGETLNVTVGGGGGAGDFSSGGGGSLSGDGGGGGGYSRLARGSTSLVVAAGGGGGGGGDNSNATTGGNAGGGGGTSGVGGSASLSANGGGGGTQSSGGSAGTGGTNIGAGGSSLNGGNGGNGGTNTAGTGSKNNGGSSGGGNGGNGDQNGNGYGAGGGGGGGYYGGGGGSAALAGNAGGGGGGGGSSYTSGTGSVNTAGSGTTPGNSSDSDRGSAGQGGTGGVGTNSGTSGTGGTLVITYGTGTSNLNTVSWAQFNTTDGTITDADPGTGTCSGWCTSTLYSLPAARASMSLVAYNGFLYAIGGEDSSCTTGNGSGDNGVCKTVYIAKLGANGEPQLWNPTSTDRSTWSYWYRDTDLSSPRSFITAVAYNNRMYLLGGKTSSGGTASIVNSAQVADITATGKLGSWSTQTNLPYNDYGYGAQVYNDRIYLIGGASSIGGAPLSTVYFNNINSDGTLNSWVQTTSLTGGRFTEGGDFSSVWGGYVYVSGGCSAVNGSGYCTSVASDTQLASINADGSLDVWNTDSAVSDSRMGQNIVAWRSYIYEIGGCSSQNTSNGECSGALDTINYGTINQDGDASTVSQSVSSGTSPCSGGSPYDCNLPGTSYVGDVLNATAIINGYLYIMGGCTNNACTAESRGVIYTAISSDGTLTAPSSCGSWTSVDSYCVNTTSLPNALAAAGTTVFNGRIYLVGGFPSITNISYTAPDSNGNISSWSNTDTTSIGATDVSYDFVFARANPSSAGTNPGNLYILGGCTNASGVGCSSYTDAVYKCNISTTGAPSGCTTTNQLQIGAIPGGCGTGLGAMVGTVYANYIYLVGGLTPNCTDLKTARYAKIDNNNNIVTVGSGWVEGSNQTATGRRRGAGFGYNGYLYVVGGYDGTSGGGVLADIEYAKINVSDGSWGPFSVSSVTINQRWGLSVPVSNSYAYVIGGCTVGAAPSSCTSRTDTIQTFQIYNNDSGTPAGYSATSTCGTGPCAASTNWYDPNYLYRQSVTVSPSMVSGGSDLTSYPALVSVTENALKTTANGGNVQNANGYDIAFTDSDGVTPLNYETEYYNGTTGQLIAWVDIPTLSASSNTGLYMYYDNSTISTFQGNVNGTWNGNYNDVLHLPNGSTLSLNDSTVNGNNGTNHSATATTGKIDGGASFNGSSQYISLPSASLPAANNFTVSLWFKTSSSGVLFSEQNAAIGSTPSSWDPMLYVDSTGHLHGGIYGGGVPSLLSSGTVNNGAWHNATLVVNKSSSSQSLYLDGSLVGTAGNSAEGPFTIVSIGAGYDNSWPNAPATPTSYFNGQIDEVRVVSSATAITSGWITTDYNNQNSPSTYESFGTAEAYNPTSSGVSLLGTSATILNGYLYVAGGCTTITCTSVTNATYYAPVNADGSIGSWSAGGNLPAARTWGKLVSAGSSLYYVGGQSGAANTTASTNVYYTTSISSGSPTWSTASNGLPSARTQLGVASWNNRLYAVGGYSSGGTVQSTVYVSPQQSSGGNITGTWSSGSTSFNIARAGLTAIAYANNLYVLGGYDGSNYLSDVQYAQISTTDGSVGSWSYTTSLPNALAYSDGFAVNGYMYLIGGRSAATSCRPITLLAPISANTTIASGNHPTGVGDWYETNQRYTGDRYGAAAAYTNGKAYVIGGGCSSFVPASQRTYDTALLSQPQVAKYSIMIDTDTDVYPNQWLLNGLDNSIGARWQLNYRSMSNTTTYCTTPAMTTWGQNTNFGDVTLGTPGVYIPKDGSGTNINCARFFYFNVTVDSSHAFGYPDDVTRGPTITDLTLQFTADPSKRLMHGRTFTGGLQQPDDTPYYTH